MAFLKCTDCRNEIPASAERCPHCGRPGLFPNVRACEGREEKSLVEQRYQAALVEASARGCSSMVQAFQGTVEGSYAVIARPLGEVQRLATNDKQGYATYYQLLDAESRFPDGDRWDALRRQADEALFPGYKEKIRFAALSLDGVGLSNYGDCSLVLRTPMIQHRASVLEDNSAAFMERNAVKMAEAGERVRGYRAPWADRAKLAVAKLANRLDARTPSQAFPNLLLQQGKTSADDDFIEAHIFGPITIRTIERVTVTSKKRSSKAVLASLSKQLARHGVALKVLR